MAVTFQLLVTSHYKRETVVKIVDDPRWNKDVIELEAKSSQPFNLTNSINLVVWS
jgi:hypothetical protein